MCEIFGPLMSANRGQDLPPLIDRGSQVLDAEHASPDSPDPPITTVLKSVSLVIIIAAGLLENACVISTIVRDRKLHRAPYYYIINLSVADLLRSVFCLPIILSTVLHGSTWRYGRSGCTLLAFSSTFFMFGALFALLILALDRHLAVVHQRFHSRKFRGLMCLALVLIGWCVAFVLAFPPVFGLGTYKFIPAEAQCSFQHRFYSDNDTFGFTLIFIAILLLVFFAYVRIFKFLRQHRRMKPITYQPARSDNWSFFGPGNNVAMLHNMMNGFARAATNPIAIGAQNQPHITGRVTGAAPVGKNEKLTRIFVAVTILYSITWVPYIVMNVWYLLDEPYHVPSLYVTVATWLTYSQVAVVPLVYITAHRPFRKSMSHSSSYMMAPYPGD